MRPYGSSQDRLTCVPFTAPIGIACYVTYMSRYYTVLTKIEASKTCEFVFRPQFCILLTDFSCPDFWPQNSNDRTVKLGFRGRLSDSAPSSPDLRLPLPAGPDQLFPPSAAYTRGKPYIKSVFLHNRPCMFFSSLQSAGPSSALLIFPCS